MRKALLTLVAALGLLLAFPVAASAEHSGNPEVEGMGHVEASHDNGECGIASITVTLPEESTPVPDTWIYRLQAEVDGEIVGNTEAVNKAVGTSTLDLAFDEDQGDGSVTVRYYYLDATEWDIVAADMDYHADYPEVTASRSFDVDTDCQEPEPGPTDTSEPKPDPTDTPDPTTEPTTEPSSEPTEDETAPATGDDTTPASSQETLPDTGVSLLWLVGGGLALVLGGYALFRRGRTQ